MRDVATPDDVLRVLSLSSVRTSARDSRHAGMMPMTRPLTVSTAKPNSSTRVSIGTDSRRGNVDPPSASSSAHGERGEREAQDRAGGGQHHRLGEQLPDDASAGRRQARVRSAISRVRPRRARAADW